MFFLAGVWGPGGPVTVGCLFAARALLTAVLYVDASEQNYTATHWHHMPHPSTTSRNAHEDQGLDRHQAL